MSQEDIAKQINESVAKQMNEFMANVVPNIIAQTVEAVRTQGNNDDEPEGLRYEDERPHFEEVYHEPEKGYRRGSYSCMDCAIPEATSFDVQHRKNSDRGRELD